MPQKPIHVLHIYSTNQTPIQLGPIQTGVAFPPVEFSFGGISGEYGKLHSYAVTVFLEEIGDPANLLSAGQALTISDGYTALTAPKLTRSSTSTNSLGNRVDFYFHSHLPLDNPFCENTEEALRGGLHLTANIRTGQLAIGSIQITGAFEMKL